MITIEPRIFEISDDNGNHLAFFIEGVPFDFGEEKIIIEEIEGSQELRECIMAMQNNEKQNEY